MGDLQDAVTRLLPAALDATVATEACPGWLRRPGRAECAGMWEAVSVIYTRLTGLELPEEAPPRERRRLDLLMTYEDGRRQILEVDEKQHFTAARAVTLEHYPRGVALGFDPVQWLARSRALSGREPGGGFGRQKPPLFPGEGGRHRQRAFRDTLADLLPSEHGWLPTIRISDTDVRAVVAAPEPAAALSSLLAGRGVPAARLI